MDSDIRTRITASVASLNSTNLMQVMFQVNNGAVALFIECQTGDLIKLTCAVYFYPGIGMNTCQPFLTSISLNKVTQKPSTAPSGGAQCLLNRDCGAMS